MLLVRGESPERAYRELTRFTPEEYREPSYLRQHLSAIGQRLAERGVLSRAPDQGAGELLWTEYRRQEQ
jgi:hypothetical protein